MTDRLPHVGIGYRLGMDPNMHTSKCQAEHNGVLDHSACSLQKLKMEGDAKAGNGCFAMSFGYMRVCGLSDGVVYKAAQVIQLTCSTIDAAFRTMDTMLETSQA